MEEHGKRKRVYTKRKIYVCEVVNEDGVICGRSFGSRKELNSHHNTIHDTTLKDDGICVNCRIKGCTEKFPNKTLMEKHCAIAHQKRFCKNHLNGCKRQFRTKELLEAHETTCNPAVKPLRTESSYPCEYEGCPEQFKALISLMPHLEKVHSLSADQVKEYLLQRHGAFVCEIVNEDGVICGRPFVGRRTLRPHQLAVHNVGLEDDNTAVIVECRGEGCALKFPNQKLMWEHYRSTHQKVWACKNRANGCKVRVNTRELLEAHEKTCNPAVKSHPCEYEGCQEQFAGVKTLASHLRKAHSLSDLRVEEYLRQGNGSQDNEGAFVCELLAEDGLKCGKPFQTKEGLKMHYIKGHKEEDKGGPYLCEVLEDGVKCGKTLETKEGLTMHHVKAHGMKDVSGPCKVLIAPGRECGLHVLKQNRCVHDRTHHVLLKCRVKGCTRTFPHKQLAKDHYHADHEVDYYCKNRSIGCPAVIKQKWRLLVHESKCDPMGKQFLTCSYEKCEVKCMSLGNLKNHLYLAHSLTFEDVQEYLDKNFDVEEDNSEDEEDEEGEDEEEEEEVVKKKRRKTNDIPRDSDTKDQYMLHKFGQPEWPFTPLNYDLFMVYYHYGLRVPVFTLQILYPTLLEADGTSPKGRLSGFRIDRNIVKILRRSFTDFQDVDLHRGHMVPYFDYVKIPVTAVRTCLYSNILPMKSNFNLSIWKKIENETREFAKKHEVTYVVTAGLFSETLETVGSKHVPLPNKFAKVMLGKNATTSLWDLTVYVIPHEPFPSDTLLSDFLGNLEDIEGQLNVKLFPELKKEHLGVVQQGQQQQSQQFKHSSEIVIVS